MELVIAAGYLIKRWLLQSIDLRGFFLTSLYLKIIQCFGKGVIPTVLDRSIFF